MTYLLTTRNRLLGKLQQENKQAFKSPEVITSESLLEPASIECSLQKLTHNLENLHVNQKCIYEKENQKTFNDSKYKPNLDFFMNGIRRLGVSESYMR
jgi:hypothetical protein